MPRRKRTVKRQILELDLDQDMELSLGPGRHSYFESPFVRRAAWFANRDELMDEVNVGERPWAFFEYEFEHPPAGVSTTEFLRQRGLLTEAEIRELDAIARIRA